MKEYRGFYINLERDEARRRLLLRQLAIAQIAPRYRRFRAIDGNEAEERAECPLTPGELGCWLSHERLLRKERETTQHLHVLEDDTVIPADAERLFATALECADEELSGEWDLLYTDVFLTPDRVQFRELSAAWNCFHEESKLHLVSLENMNFACTSSFFVHRDAVGRLADLLEGQWCQGKVNDIYLRELVHTGEIRAYTTMPFLTTVGRESENSSIRGTLDRSRLVLQIYRRSFFKGADHAELLTEIRELTRGCTFTAQRELFLEALGFQLSDQWCQF